ncbi:MAG TPA: hypothetical protein VJU17_06025 [Gemmatimonadales bacterium]|nr:hypothetical protein [Gemmatimonadales bacterium]
MPVRRLVCGILTLGGCLWTRPGWSQTKDQARLIFTVSGGVVRGTDLWDVDAQPVQFITPTDTMALGRDIRTNIGISFAGTYFPGDNFGIAAEAYLLGLGFEDSCRMVFSSGASDVITTCQSIQGATKSASAVTLSAGPVYRFNSRSTFSPYFRGNLGLVFSNQSSIRMVGHFPTAEGTADLIVYDDDHESRIDPQFAVGAGFTAAIAPGYQLRWEIRDNITGVQTVTAATPQARTVPPHEMAFKHLFSLSIGFDVVLERRKGRRY